MRPMLHCFLPSKYLPSVLCAKLVGLPASSDGAVAKTLLSYTGTTE